MYHIYIYKYIYINSIQIFQLRTYMCIVKESYRTVPCAIEFFTMIYKTNYYQVHRPQIAFTSFDPSFHPCYCCAPAWPEHLPPPSDALPWSNTWPSHVLLAAGRPPPRNSSRARVPWRVVAALCEQVHDMLCQGARRGYAVGALRLATTGVRAPAASSVGL